MRLTYLTGKIGRNRHYARNQNRQIKWGRAREDSHIPSHLPDKLKGGALEAFKYIRCVNEGEEKAHANRNTD
jgi:hypothetical protein